MTNASAPVWFNVEWVIYGMCESESSEDEVSDLLRACFAIVMRRLRLARGMLEMLLASWCGGKCVSKWNGQSWGERRTGLETRSVWFKYVFLGGCKLYPSQASYADSGEDVYDGTVDCQICHLY